MLRIIRAFFYSMDGIVFAFRSEPAFRQVLLLAICAVAYAIIGVDDHIHKLLLCIVSFLLVIVELLNTGIEKAIDRISLDRHPLAKAAKDVGSAAQFFALLLYFLVLFYSYNK